MQTLQTPRDSLLHASSPRYIAEPWSIEISVQDARNQNGSRHDEQELNTRIVPADPYTAWLQEREADRRCSTERASDKRRR